MVEMTAILMRNAYLKEWIDGATIQKISGNCDGEEAAETVDTGFAWALYDHILKLLSILVTLDSPKLSKKDARSLKDLVGKLFLWGDGFREGNLENILDCADDLRETVVGLLAGIGNILTTSKLSSQIQLSAISDHIKSWYLHGKRLPFPRLEMKSVNLPQSLLSCLRKQNWSLRATMRAMRHQTTSLMNPLTAIRP